MLVIYFMFILNLPGIYLKLHTAKHKMNVKSYDYIKETPKLIQLLPLGRIIFNSKEEVKSNKESQAHHT